MAYTTQFGHRTYPARVVGSGPSPLVISRGHFGLEFDFLERVEDHVVHLRSGAIFQKSFVYGLPGKATVQQSGRSLWDAVSAGIPPSSWTQITGQPGALLCEETYTSLNAWLFAISAKNGSVVAGRREPVEAHHAFFPFAADAPLIWDFDWVTDCAHPKASRIAHSYCQVRVLTAVEWQAEAAKPLTAVRAQTPKGKGGPPDQYDWPAFTREVVRFANIDGLTTRKELTAHMRAWCATSWETQPEESTILRKVRELCPEDIPAQ